MFDFDEGQGGGSNGPFITWSAKGTEDGSVDPRNFYIRSESGKEAVTDRFKKGVVFDITKLKTGWQESSGTPGVAPSWEWNDTPAKMAPRPGENWKKGFHIPVAMTKDEAAVWEQAGAGAFQAFVDVARQIKSEAAENKGLLPMVKMTGVETIKFAKGSTNYPKLEVAKWVPAPDCLSDMASVDTGGADDEAAATDEDLDDEF